jgi:adiponectin receptor
MFVLMGLSAVFPVLHGIRLYGIEYMREAVGLDWVVLQGLLYISGAAIYAARVPEKWSPGKYDIWGSSHQIFHVLVVLAATSHLVGLLKAFDYEHSGRGGAGVEMLVNKIWS